MNPAVPDDTNEVLLRRLGMMVEGRYGKMSITESKIICVSLDLRYLCSVDLSCTL